MVSQHVSLEELQAFVLDEESLSHEARHHLATCPDCQYQVACTRQTMAYLTSRLYRSQCPSAETLSFYCLPGALSEEEQRQVTAHLAACPLCLAEFADSRQFLNSSE
jgi:anti-sigma factor RsiW